MGEGVERAGAPVLAAVDFSEFAERVVDAAADLAQAVGAPVRIVHVADPEPEFIGYEGDPKSLRDTHAAAYRREHRQVQAFGDRLRERGIDATALLIQGPTLEKLLGEIHSAGARWVVVGSHGRGAVQRLLLGSVSAGLVRSSPVPVLVVPPGRD